MHDQARAHAARLQRDVQRAARQAVVAGRSGCGTDGDHFSMGAGVVTADRAVETAPDNLAVLHQHCPHGYFTQGFLNHRVLFEGGVLADECGAILSDFFKARRAKPPL